MVKLLVILTAWAINTYRSAVELIINILGYVGYCYWFDDNAFIIMIINVALNCWFVFFSVKLLRTANIDHGDYSCPGVAWK